MAALPAGLTQKDIDRYAQLDAAKRRLDGEHSVLNEKIKQAHQNAGLTGTRTLTYPSDKYGTVIVKLGEQKRVDLEALAEKFPQKKYPEFYTAKIDTKEVPADVTAKFRTNIIATLSISVAE